MLKTFENYNSLDDKKVWIVGVPSGEAFQINLDLIKILYGKRLIHYNDRYKKLTQGFFAFKDSDKEEFLKTVGIKENEDDRFLIYENEFNKVLIDQVKEIVDECPFHIELYIQDRFMSFSFENDHHFEIEVNRSSPKYTLIRNYKGKQIDKYNISNDDLLLKRIDVEIYQS